MAFLASGGWKFFGLSDGLRPSRAKKRKEPTLSPHLIGLRQLMTRPSSTEEEMEEKKVIGRFRNYLYNGSGTIKSKAAEEEN